MDLAIEFIYPPGPALDSLDNKGLAATTAIRQTLAERESGTAACWCLYSLQNNYYRCLIRYYGRYVLDTVNPDYGHQLAMREDNL